MLFSICAYLRLAKGLTRHAVVVSSACVRSPQPRQAQELERQAQMLERQLISDEQVDRERLAAEAEISMATEKLETTEKLESVQISQPP